MSEHDHDESLSSEDEEHVESFLEAVTKTGVIERRKDLAQADQKDHKDAKKHKFYFYVLVGGSLFEYRTVKDTEPKETIHLKGCEIVESTQPSSTALEIRRGGATLCLFVHQSAENRAEWAKALGAALDKEQKPAPARVKQRRATIRARMKKAVVGRVATSGAGKMMAKAAVPEEVYRLINALRALLQTHVGEEPALEVEDNIIKLYVKCFVLEDDGQIRLEEFAAMDAPLRLAFAAISKLRDQTVGRRADQAQLVEDGLARIREHLRETESQLTGLLTPHLKPHSISRIASIFRYVGDPAFLRKAIVAPVAGPGALAPDYKFLDEEIDSLCSAMDKYLAVNLYVDE